MNIKRIRNLLNINSLEDVEDIRDILDNYIDDFKEKNKEIPLDSLKAYPDSYIDIIYIYYRSSRTLKPTQKVLLNKK